MATINTFPETIRAEIFALIPDTRLRLVCKLWRDTFDSINFKTLMGQIYEKWLRSAHCLWEPVQLKWQKIFASPLHFDSDLCGRMTWARKMEKITKFIFVINPAMISFIKKRLGNPVQNSLQKIALQTLKQQNQNEYDEAVRNTRLCLKDECLLDVISRSEGQLIAAPKKKPGVWERVGYIFGYAPKTVRDEIVYGNLATDSLMPKLSAQFFIMDCSIEN